MFVLAIRVMDAFRFFDTIYVLTNGGPGTATETITLYTYAARASACCRSARPRRSACITLLIVAAMIAGDDPHPVIAANGSAF